MGLTTTRKRLPSQGVERLARTKETPFLVMDRGLIRQKFGEFEQAFGANGIFYALKANTERRIVELLYQLGAGFEVSSEAELRFLLRLGVLPQRIISSNPLKSQALISAAHGAGVKHFAFDSPAEVEKLSELAPGSRVYVRLSVSNEGSKWPLHKKFGVEVAEAVELLAQARERHLEPYGIAFHVGSQCTEAPTWSLALEKSKTAWELARSRGIRLRMLNIGGGFPIKYTQPVPAIRDIAREIKETAGRLFPADIEIIVEPGRALVGEAGVLVASVIAKAVRNGQKWLYLDVGVFNGLMESLGGISYPVITANDGHQKQWVLAGPSCDSLDVISEEVGLPEPAIGDKAYIMSAGAYTTAYASRFNGCPIPRIYFI